MSDPRPVGTIYRQVLRPHPREADQRCHLITFIVVGHRLVMPDDPQEKGEVLEVIEAREKETLTLE